ncbi:MAG: hypothetical protein M1840_002177 [Geoglossum simile]|nr:MAG: hypothetical protein M1840_002177 [Geoglossum simile]
MHSISVPKFTVSRTIDNAEVELLLTSPSAASVARQSACLAAVYEIARIFEQIAPDGIEIRLPCTDPKYWRHGAASKLIKMGEDEVLVVGTSPCGSMLFSSPGFVALDEVCMKVDEEECEVRHAIMVKW